MQGQKNTDTVKIENGLYWLKKKKMSQLNEWN